MGEAMVTARMSEDKKRAGARILAREGLTASQAVNRLYDRLIETGDADFLVPDAVRHDASAWRRAAQFVDSLSVPQKSRFDNMTKGEIKMERLRARGLM